MIYCGKKIPIPQNYERRGEPFECLRKGVGVGLYVLGPRNHNPLPPPSISSVFSPLVWLHLLLVLVLTAFLGFLFLYEIPHALDSTI